MSKKVITCVTAVKVLLIVLAVVASAVSVKSTYQGEAVAVESVSGIAASL